MKPGLITLADLPALAAGKQPTTRIVVARLDDKLRDPRYGAFKITQSDVDGWKRNLTETFGGQVSIDFDHSSDRGRGTKAAAWITGLQQDGKLVTADVQFTPAGAKAVRDGHYKYISPTFVADLKDEHGDSHGKALIGAALTNRPVLRQGMPTLSLSRDRFDDVAIPRKRKKTMSKTQQPKTEVMVLRGRKLVPKMLTRKQLAKELRRTLARPPLDGPHMLGGPPASVDAVTTLAQYAPAGVQHAGTIDWQPPQSGPGRQPPGLDDSGKALHALIAARAASTGQPYLHAMADVTGVPTYRERSDVPPALGQQQGFDLERSGLYNAASAFSASAGIGWFDALEYLEDLAELAELQKDDGSAEVPWLDSRTLASPPRPWSDEDWARDQLRANAAGVDVDQAAWQAGATLGHDVVGEAADGARAQAIATHQQRSEGRLDQARAREDDRRSAAINDELTRRARNRTDAPSRPADHRPTGTSKFF